MKKLLTICALVFLLAVNGLLVASYLIDRRHGILSPAPPAFEGYQESTAGNQIRQARSVVVERLYIENNLLKSYEDILDYAAFAPGSGWLKLATRDGISPRLSFNHVTEEDIRQFNRFSESIGLPIRSEFSGNVLRLFLKNVENRPLLAGGEGASETSVRSMREISFYEYEEPPRLVVRKDRTGKVHLVAAEKPLPDSRPEETETLAARQHPKRFKE